MTENKYVKDNSKIADLDAMQYRVTQENGTEPAFSGEYV